MPYTVFSMREALKEIAIAKGEYVAPPDAASTPKSFAPGNRHDFVGTAKSQFVWEAAPGKVDERLANQFHHQKRGRNPLNDLLEYCWLVYSKALSAGGAQLIGRTGDLWIPEQLKRAGLSDKDDASDNLWKSGTTGTIQKMDKWSPTVNDCWVLGGVHRLAPFELVSDIVLRNLWDFGQNFHVVTAREILGLLHFGYEVRKEGGKTRLLCGDEAAAKNATIQEYDSFMKGLQDKGPQSIRFLLSSVKDHLHLEVQTFDRTQLRHVTPDMVNARNSRGGAAH
jgi:hypothetical protein